VSCNEVRLSRGSRDPSDVQTAHIRLEPDLQNVAVVRRFVHEQLAGHPEPVVDDVSLLATELVTNAIVHVESKVAVGVAADDAEVLVAVTDQRHDRVPVIGRMPNADDVVEMSRGIALVCSIASDFGWYLLRNGPGKVVWFAIDVDAARSRPRA
jgi:anti-sigma regulatory factor (Ser/Thr protein kinase)